MVKDVKISSYQLSMMLMGFWFGSTTILNLASLAKQDAWLAYIIGWACGFVLIGMYVGISRLNPSKTLIEILRDYCGKWLGSVFSILYIWYFIHLASLVARNFGEYLVNTVYFRTPMIFIIIFFALELAYVVRCGLEVTARTSEIFVPILILLVLTISGMLAGSSNFSNLFPFLEKGIGPVVKTSLNVATFPFGEAVVFLMVFPYLNRQESLAKIAYLSLTIIGTVILLTVFRDILVLGRDVIERSIFPPAVSVRLTPSVNIDPFLDINLLISGGNKITVCISAATMGITQLFNLDDYKPFVLPVTALIVTTSIWVFQNVFEMLRWSQKIWAIYSLPFQVIIPLYLLLASWLKYKREMKNDQKAAGKTL